ncbi:MAG: hypothetical protein R3C60_08045 [Parvularculaceae bacterium]
MYGLLKLIVLSALTLVFGVAQPMKDLIKHIRQQKISCATGTGFNFVLNFDIEIRQGGYAIMQPFISVENKTPSLIKEYLSLKEQAWGASKYRTAKKNFYGMIFKIPSVNYADNYYGEHQLSTDIEQYTIAFRNKCLEEFSHIESVKELKDYLFEGKPISGPAHSFFEMYLASKYMSRDEFTKITHNGSELSQKAQDFFLDKIYGNH